MNIDEIMFYINVYDVITFRTIDNTLIIKINPKDLLDKNSAIKKALETFPEKKFRLSTTCLIDELYNTNDEFVRYYLNLLEEKRRIVR